MLDSKLTEGRRRYSIKLNPLNPINHEVANSGMTVNEVFNP